jgi:hypothetical protein
MYHELVMQAGGGIVKEDDIIDSDNEVIVNPAEMGKKNPGIDSNGGQTPTGLPLGDEKNKGNAGLSEDGVEDEVEGGEVEDVAAAIAGGLADGIAGDGIETEPEVNALPGEGIPQDDDDAAINAELGEPVAPPDVGGGAGLVGQIAALNARVAELEALIGGSEAPEVGAEVEVGGEEGEEDELSIGGDNAEDEGGEEEEEGEGESEEDDSEEKEDDESEKDDSEEGEDEDTKLLLGDEEEEKK